MMHQITIQTMQRMFDFFGVGGSEGAVWSLFYPQMLSSRSFNEKANAGGAVTTSFR